MAKRDTQERRRLRREQVALERAERLREMEEASKRKGDRLVFTWRLPSGNPFEIRFDFTNAVVVPFYPTARDPMKDLRARLELEMLLRQLADEGAPN